MNLVRSAALAAALAACSLTAGCFVVPVRPHRGHGSAVVVYRHGHPRHRCGRGCAHYAPRRHGAAVVVYRHGHPRHRCGPSCGSYAAPPRTVVVYRHGHPRHRCGSGCSRSVRRGRRGVVRHR